MHEVYNPINLLGKEIEVSYHIDDIGEDATVVELDPLDGQRRFEIVFKKFPEEGDDERCFWSLDHEPYAMETGLQGEKASFTDIGHMRRIHLNIKKLDHTEEEGEEVPKESTNENMQAEYTVKQLSDKLKVDVVYVNGYIQTLLKMGKASIAGKVEKPAGSRGKPSNIYKIDTNFVG